MSQMVQADIRFEGRALSKPPEDLDEVALVELGDAQYSKLIEWLNGRPLTPASYVRFITEK